MEIHSYLHRMRELSIQAANDTLTDSDRSQIQNEMQQLNEGVNQIANHTTFNGINLMNVDKPPTYYDKYFGYSERVEETLPIDPDNPAYIAPIVFNGVRKDEMGFEVMGLHQGVAYNGENAVIVGSWDHIIVYNPNESPEKQWSNDVQIYDKAGEIINRNNQNVFKHVFWNGENYVALREKGGVFSSKDGLKWEQKIDDIPVTESETNLKLSSMTHNGDTYVAVNFGYQSLKQTC